MPINILKIDLSDCTWNETGRGISWQGLDMAYQPRAIELVKVEVFFSEPSPEPWDSSIRQITFRDCFIPNVTADAFKGLTILEEIHVFSSFINSIMSDGFSHLPMLRTLEFASTYIGEIQENAVNNLPAIKDIAFTQCHVEVIKRNAINNVKLPTLPSSNDCPEIDVRISRAELANMNEWTARMLQSTENLPLPKFGARLLFLHSSIGTLFTNSITSDLFAFAILGGNTITHFGERALNLQLSNQCEISALMFSSNKFVNLHEGALASATGLSAVPHATYLVLTNNTFENVDPNGFIIHPTIKIFKMENNFFSCDCNLLSWIYEEDTTTTQTELENQLLRFSQCNATGLNLSEFVSTCPRTIASSTSRPWNGQSSTPTPIMSYTEPVVIEEESSSASLSSSPCTLILLSFGYAVMRMQ